jgi:hypothetical protein
MPLLEVHQLPKEEIYRDMIRVNESHRVNKRTETIKEGHLCLVRANGKKCFAILRGYQDGVLPEIRMDDYTRGASRLGLELSKPYEFEFEEVGLIQQWCWAWNATEIGYQVASRIALIGFVMGLIGLFLGIVGLIK